MKDQILKLYEEGLNSSQIEKKLNTTYQKVVKVLLEFGIDYKTDFAEKQKLKYEKALELYGSGMQFKKICKEVGVGPNSLRPVIKEKYGSLRLQRESLYYHIDRSEEGILKRSAERRKYPIDENAFDDLFKEDVAYWIGFLYSDGTIGEGEGNYRIALTLQYQDKTHLEKFCRFLKTPIERIKENPSTKSYQVTIASYIIWKRLRELGFCNKKSWKAIPPPELSINRDFWRGVIDGDGSLLIVEPTEAKYSKLRIAIGLCGTPDTVSQFVEYISEELNRDFYNLKVDERTTTFSNFRASSHEDVLRITELLYKDANIYLDRKYNKYLEIKKKLNIL